MQPKTGELSLNQIYLDPNNYRFRDHKDYRKVADEDIAKECEMNKLRFLRVRFRS